MSKSILVGKYTESGMKGEELCVVAFRAPNGDIVTQHTSVETYCKSNIGDTLTIDLNSGRYGN
jgi:hypothetical protein